MVDSLREGKLFLYTIILIIMIGAGGLWEDVLKGIQRLQIGEGFEAELVVVILAIILDRVTAGFGISKKQQ